MTTEEILEELKQEADSLSRRARALYVERRFADGSVMDATALRLQHLIRRLSEKECIDKPAISAAASATASAKPEQKD